MREQGLEPDVISCDAMIRACEKGARPEHAIYLIWYMQQRGIKPKVISHGELDPIIAVLSSLRFHHVLTSQV
jgi:pentatricopeptide repeat protein